MTVSNYGQELLIKCWKRHLWQLLCTEMQLHVTSAFIYNTWCNKSYSCAVLGKLLLKVMYYNIALLPKKVTNYVT